MAIDIRAKVICNLGDLISASVSDDYIQGSGLIKTTGSCELNGIYSPSFGTNVTFSYIKNGIERKIPRTLKVISSFADPFRRRTTVQLGCPLTYMQDAKEPIKWQAFDDPLNTGFEENDQSIVVVPIFASSIANECLFRIGLSGSTGLSNAFSISEFDFSSGYVNILSDLLVSECRCGYVDGNETFQTFKIDNNAGQASLILESDLIDIGPIGVGQPPGDSVVVTYSSLKLKSPDPDESEQEVANRNWEEEKTEGAEQEVVLEGEYVTGINTGDTWTQTYKYIPETRSKTYYDTWDRVILRRTVEKTILAEVNPEYVKQGISSQNLGTSVGNQNVYRLSETIIKYKKNAPVAVAGTPTLEEGYDEVESETSCSYETSYAKMASLSFNYYNADDDTFASIPDEPYPDFSILNTPNPAPYAYSSQLTEKTTTTSETYSRQISFVTSDNTRTDLGNIPVTKTVTNKKVAYPRTGKGQQYITSLIEEKAGESSLAVILSTVLSQFSRLTDTGTETRTFTGREIALQTRPPAADRAISSLADGGDPNNGYSVESSSQIELISGSASATRRVEFSMPFAPDDRFVKFGTGPTATFLSIPSNAAVQATAFGRVQNLLLMGNRYGINIQIVPELMPPRPFSPIAIQANGISAIYATNATSWVMDANGIIASTDALFIGAIGQA